MSFLSIFTYIYPKLKTVYFSVYCGTDQNRFVATRVSTSTRSTTTDCWLIVGPVTRLVVTTRDTWGNFGGLGGLSTPRSAISTTWAAIFHRVGNGPKKILTMGNFIVLLVARGHHPGVRSVRLGVDGATANPTPASRSRMAGGPPGGNGGGSGEGCRTFSHVRLGKNRESCVGNCGGPEEGPEGPEGARGGAVASMGAL